MREYFLLLDQGKDNPYLNKAKLIVRDDGRNTTLIPSITNPTSRVWATSSNFYEDLDIVDWEQDNGCVITEKCAKILISKYANIWPPNMN